VFAALQVARNAVSQKHAQWAAVMVHGFADVPFSWVHREHDVSYAGGGENDYVIVISPNNSYFLFIMTGAKDQMM
jgi:hypothetical protein